MKCTTRPSIGRSEREAFSTILGRPATSGLSELSYAVLGELDTEPQVVSMIAEQVERRVGRPVRHNTVRKILLRHEADWRTCRDIKESATERMGHKIHEPNARKILNAAVSDGVAEMRKVRRPGLCGLVFEYRESPWGDE